LGPERDHRLGKSTSGGVLGDKKMTLQELKQSIKQELYPRYCPNLLCQKIWYGEKVKEIHCMDGVKTLKKKGKKLCGKN